MLVNRNPHHLPGKPKLLLIIILCLGMITFSACQVNQPEVNTAIDVSPILITPELTEVPVTIQVIDQPGNPQDTQPAVSITATSAQLEPSAIPTDYQADFWKELPIFPDSISDKMREVYEKGLEMGNDPQSFIRVGDCNSKNPDFLAGFDGKYNLGEYTYLQPTIDYFKGSFGRYNQTANPGNTTSRVVVSFWNNGDCLANEPMLECQFRLDNPSIAFISLGTIDAKYDYKYPTSFERNLRRIIEKTLEKSLKKIIGANDIMIKLSPEDYERIEKTGKEYFASSGISKIRFELSNNIKSGGCLIESEIGNIDARIETQIGEIIKDLENYFINKEEV